MVKPINHKNKNEVSPLSETEHQSRESIYISFTNSLADNFIDKDSKNKVFRWVKIKAFNQIAGQRSR